MPKFKFTARGIKAIKSPPPPMSDDMRRELRAENSKAERGEKIRIETGQIDYWDASLPGFMLRVSYAGRKTWCVSYRHEGRRRRLTLGTYPALDLAEAREKAGDALHDVAHGKDPAAEKAAQRRAETLGEVAAEYIEKHAKKKKRSWRKDDLAFERDILPRWRHRKAASITRKEVVRLLDDIVERGAPIQANRVLAILRKTYNWAISRDIVSVNPCTGIERPSEENTRERVLTDDEIRAVWAALDKQPPMVRAAFKLRLLTAQRGQEVATMRWEDIDSNWWTIPGVWSKNRLAHRVPLSPQAVKVLNELDDSDDRGGWVFQSAKQEGPRTVLWRTVPDIRADAEVEFVPHDVRRSAASKMTGDLGISRLTVSKLLNHVETGVTAVYDRHSYDREKRLALDAWGQRVAEIVAGKKAGAKVVPLRQRAEDR